MHDSTGCTLSQHESNRSTHRWTPLKLRNKRKTKQHFRNSAKRSAHQSLKKKTRFLCTFVKSIDFGNKREATGCYINVRKLRTSSKKREADNPSNLKRKTSTNEKLCSCCVCDFLWSSDMLLTTSAKNTWIYHDGGCRANWMQLVQVN